MSFHDFFCNGDGHPEFGRLYFVNLGISLIGLIPGPRPRRVARWPPHVFLTLSRGVTVVSTPAPVPFASRLLVGVLGAVLLTAAGLKVTGGERVSAVAPGGWAARAEVRGALIAAEVALGLWFVSGVGVRAARWAAVVTFTAFAAASGAAALAGAASCDCLGPARVAPRAVAAFDLTAVVLLVAARFRGPWEPADRAAGRVALGTAALSAAGAAVAALGLDAAGGRDDRPLAVDPVVVSVGECRPGEAAAATVTFTNRTADPIQVIVAQSDCACVTADVPVWVAAGEARGVRVEVRPPTEPGAFARKVGWLTTAGRLPGELRGVVVGSRP